MSESNVPESPTTVTSNATKVARSLALLPMLALFVITILPVSIVRVVNDTETSRRFAICIGEDCQDTQLSPNDATWFLGGSTKKDKSVALVGLTDCRAYYESQGVVGLYAYYLGAECRSYKWAMPRFANLLLFTSSAYLVWALAFRKRRQFP
jgi:hypothetical protein